jgi:hypothetical protein
MKNKLIVPGLILLIGAAVGLQWYRTREPSGNELLDRTAEKLNKDMPRPYVNGLLFENAHVAGDRLVIDVFIPDIRLTQIDVTKLPMIRNQEQGDLVDAACADPDLRKLMDSKVRVARRFLDQHHKVIFELSVSSSDCLPKAIE